MPVSPSLNNAPALVVARNPAMVFSSSTLKTSIPNLANCDALAAVKPSTVPTAVSPMPSILNLGPRAIAAAPAPVRPPAAN